MKQKPSHPVTRPRQLSADLQRLADQVRAVETGRATGAAEAAGEERVVCTGWPAVDAALPGGGLSRCVLHEWMAGQQGERANTSSRNASVASSLLTHLAWQATASVDTGPPSWAVWIGRACWPYPQSLVRQGKEGRRLLMRSLWADAPDSATRLWTIDQALACPAIGVIVADGSRFDMPATRRLQLNARRGGALLLLARPPTDRGELSAAATRWFVTPEPTTSDQPRWRIELLRCKGAGATTRRAGTGRSSVTTTRVGWLVERSHAQGDLRLATDLADRSVAPTAAPTKRAG